MGQKFRQNHSISHGLGDTSNFKFYHFCQKFENCRHFWKEEKSLRIEPSILHIYPMGQKFRRNRSISHGLGDTSSFKFYHFCQKFENSKWLPFLERQKFFETECCSRMAARPGQRLTKTDIYSWP